MHSNGRTHSLPIVFQSLDVEGKSRALPVVHCPERDAALTAGTCGRCRQFRRIDFDAAQLPVLRCMRSGEPRAEPRNGLCSVQDVLRIPAVCVSLDTSIAKLLCVLAAERSDDIIPVLDAAAKPRGYVTSASIEQCIVEGVDIRRTLANVMTPFLTRVAPNLSLAQAAELVARSVSGSLVVTDADGVLLGIVRGEDLAVSPAGS